MKPYDAPSPGLIAAFVESQKLALIVSHSPSGVLTTPLPLIAHLDDSGHIARFEGHFARRNPHVEMLETHPRALLLFQGAHRYIPTGAVSDPAWVPTWNYMLAQFEVDIALTPLETRAAVDRLVDAVEPGDWRPATHIPQRHAPMLARIVAFDARVIRTSAKFKLGQDENPADWHEIVDWLGDDPLAIWMKRARTE